MNLASSLMTAAAGSVDQTFRTVPLRAEKGGRGQSAFTAHSAIIDQRLKDFLELEKEVTPMPALGAEQAETGEESARDILLGEEEIMP